MIAPINICHLLLSTGGVASIPATVHWWIRNDGNSEPTVVGLRPRGRQIMASPPLIKLDQFGAWVHLAVTQLVDRQPDGEKALRSWATGTPVIFRETTLSLVHNVSRAMDSSTLFARALRAGEIRTLHTEGRPETTFLMIETLNTK